jgi:hypothetical protein
MSYFSMNITRFRKITYVGNFQVGNDSDEYAL